MAGSTGPEPDLGRMCRERLDRLRGAMDAHGVDALVLLHGPHVSYATGLVPAAIDATHANFQRPVAIVTGEGPAHLFTDQELAPAILAGDSVELHGALWPELDEGVEGVAAALAATIGDPADRRLGVDEVTGAMARAGVVDPRAVADAARVVGAAQLVKTADEVACIRLAQHQNEQAMDAPYVAAVPGARRSEVAGAFLASLREQGNDANMIDPIFQTMVRRRGDGPRTSTGDVAFPTGVDDPELQVGDLVWVDSGVCAYGYVSDFGRTWVVGRDPSDAERALFDRWCGVMSASYDALRPGATLAAVGRAATEANGGVRPWLPHFYLAHGLGIASAEMPMIGTDLGDEFDEGFVLAPGMVVVLEPVVWEGGLGGYRAEEVVVITDDGWAALGGGHTYAPFAA